MGNRTARLLASSALLLAAACSDTAPTTPPALDRFYYPTGLAIRHVDDAGAPADCLGGPGCHTQLLVVSSNFDLRYDSASGGTVIAVDVDEALKTPLAPLQRPALLGVGRIGSFGGELAILDGATCPGWTGPAQALVASRSQNLLYRLDLDFGSPAQLPAQQIPLESSFGDPYGVRVACGTFGGVPQQLAFVSYLRTPSSEGELSRIDLAQGAGNARTQIDLGANVGGSVAPAHGTVFDRVSGRLYVTERFGKSGFSPLRWLSLAAPEITNSVDLYALVRGAELRGLALSSDGDPASGRPPSRAYLALRIYDADVASATGLRPTNDVAGALVVLDIAPGPDGQPAARFLNVVPIDRGASEIRVVPRPVPSGGTPLRDLVAVTCTDDGTVALYDDETGRVARVLGICGGIPGELEPSSCLPGDPLTGKQPFGLETELLQTGHARLYVGSFDRSWVNVIEIDPLNPASSPVSWARIGPERL